MTGTTRIRVTIIGFSIQGKEREIANQACRQVLTANTVQSRLQRRMASVADAPDIAERTGRAGQQAQNQKA